MACLGARLYDPAVAVVKPTSALLAMTAIDTVNLRITFPVPTNGRVLVRLQSLIHGANTFPQILMGVLEGSTVRMRVSPMAGMAGTALATTQLPVEAVAVISGLTPGNTTWDAAYGVETIVASTGLKYGGPNDTVANNAFGGFRFEVWEA